MESQIELVEKLIARGQAFTFQDFSHLNKHGSEFGGEDSAEWLTWKTRVDNLVHRFMAGGSAACRLAEEAIGIHTRGNYSVEFDRAKSTLLKALELTLGAMREDCYGELLGPKSETESPAISNKVFVVHGHDHALRGCVKITWCDHATLSV